MEPAQSAQPAQPAQPAQAVQTPAPVQIPAAALIYPLSAYDLESHIRKNEINSTKMFTDLQHQIDTINEDILKLKYTYSMETILMSTLSGLSLYVFCMVIFDLKRR
jgi:hypothetical protein